MDDVKIPAAFWKTMTAEEFSGVVGRNGLDGMQCARLWKMMGRTDPCPTELDLFINQFDLMRAFPPR